ncbi:hypothetical protein CLV92_12032 [Kineococcus xinjiangensis]|uniref:Uncharacterized protein n=1 Tax=Kineococcus xinjiangensis TaxID=512762 RepID=A0A2S6ICL8_9ACTN|nr:hypothetical protein [Kineococcus xinjiangensis]PPK91913.1 hypothetical protein CLV92_12032 [Kineococcus xinjiangensis]
MGNQVRRWLQRPIRLAGGAAAVVVLVGAAMPYIDFGAPFSWPAFVQFLIDAAAQLLALALLLTFVAVTFRLLYALQPSAKGGRGTGARPPAKGAGAAGWLWATGLGPGRHAGPANATAVWGAEGGRRVFSLPIDGQAPASGLEAGVPVGALPAGGGGRDGYWDDQLAHLPHDWPSAPVLRHLSVEPAVTCQGLPVQVSWSFEHAVEVTVDGRGGFPPTGSTQLLVEESRAIPVIGRNGLGERPEWTELVVVLPMPRIDTLTVPAPPQVRLRADVSALLDARPATWALQKLYAEQDGVRPLAPPPQLQPMLTPAPLWRWWQGATRQVHSAVTSALGAGLDTALDALVQARAVHRNPPQRPPAGFSAPQHTPGAEPSSSQDHHTRQEGPCTP